MAFGDSKIQQNVSVTPTQNAHTSAVTSGTADSAAIVVPVSVDEEALKLLGLTPEQYALLSPEEKAKVNNQIKQIINKADEPNFGITGLSVEKTNTKATDDQLAPTDNPIEVKAEVQNKESILRDDIPKQTITEKDWKQLSPEQRWTLAQAKMDELLKDVPEDQKDAARQELLDNRIKQTRGFSDERWANMSDARKERLRERFKSDYNLVIENGFTKEDISELSYEEKLHLDIETKDKQIKKLTESLKDMSINYEAGSIENPEEVRENKEKLIAKLKADQEKIIKNDELFEAIKSLGENFTIKPAIIDTKTTPITELSEYKQDVINLQEILSENKSGDSKAPIYPELPGTKREQEKTSFERDFKTLYGHEFDAQNEADITKLKKIMANKFKELPQEEQTMARLSYFNGVVLELAEKTQSPNKKVSQKAEDDLNIIIDTATDLGITKDLIDRMARGEKLSQEEIQTLNAALGDLSGVINKIIKTPSIHKKNFAKDIATIQGYMLADYGVKPNDEFNNMYKNDKYTEFVGDGLRQVKGSKAVGGYLKTMLPQLAASVQSSEFDKNMLSYADTFEDDNDKIEFQKQLFDIVGDLAVENQSHAFKTTMSSKFDEVQEYAASNIYKLDESVRDWASEYTKSLGKENLTDAIRTEPPAPDNISDRTSANNADPVSETYSNSPVTNTISNNQPSVMVSYDDLTPNTQTVYNTIETTDGMISHYDAVKNFKQLTRAEQENLLKALPKKLFDRLPVTICDNFPELVPAFVDTGRGTEIFSRCSSSLVKTSAVKYMNTSGDKTRKQLQAYMTAHPEEFNKMTQEAVLGRKDQPDEPKKTVDFERIG